MMGMERFEMFADMARYVGKTVTIFTASGGISGSGFTGVLACVDEKVVKLITRIGAPPACPLGSTCTGFEDFGGFGLWGGPGRCGSGLWGGRGFAGGFGNFMGSVTEIPLGAIVSFTHNAI
ncbi:MAG: hypothetical protein FWC67_04225 [Defluviitaleaceae bacterium]|nr:hypothetical protein [Defluviitaleaceae bacterium]